MPPVSVSITGKCEYIIMYDAIHLTIVVELSQRQNLMQIVNAVVEFQHNRKKADEG